MMWGPHRVGGVSRRISSLTRKGTFSSEFFLKKNNLAERIRKKYKWEIFSGAGSVVWIILLIKSYFGSLDYFAMQ